MQGVGADFILHPLIHTSGLSESTTKCGSGFFRGKVWIKVSTLPEPELSNKRAEPKLRSFLWKMRLKRNLPVCSFLIGEQNTTSPA